MKAISVLIVTAEKQIEQDILADVLDMMASETGDDGMERHAFRLRTDRTIQTTLTVEKACRLAMFAADIRLKSPEGEAARKRICSMLQNFARQSIS